MSWSIPARAKPRAIIAAIERVLPDAKLRTRDLKGSADTVTCGKAVAAAID
jgi:tartrate dehydrogenase/decarboxylase/D-malate dehydrogenase